MIGKMIWGRDLGREKSNVDRFVVVVVDRGMMMFCGGFWNLLEGGC